MEPLLRRLGYVKLTAYGLVLTPDDRVVSLRARLVERADGGHLVGWRDADLELVLATLPPARPAPGLVTMAPVVASPHHPGAGADDADDDEWAWQLALVRARAANSAVAPTTGAPSTAAPVAPLALAAGSGAIERGAGLGGAAAVVAATRAAVAAASRTSAAILVVPPPPGLSDPPRTTPCPTASPDPIARPRATVLPVPVLPIASASDVARMAPVVRPRPTEPAPRRFPRGTEPPPVTRPAGRDHTRSPGRAEAAPAPSPLAPLPRLSTRLPPT
ncbi:MAG: hypothetical protein KBG28_10605 [Kofleriaceae bacterium]|nr:hypothetical protein [Kofleriaceae bacterium]